MLCVLVGVVAPVRAVGAQRAPGAVVGVVLGSSLADVGVAAGLRAAGEVDAVIFAESPDALGASARGAVAGRALQRWLVVGGTAAVGGDVEAELRGLVPGRSVPRLAGATRLETSALAARRVIDGAGPGCVRVVLANGWSLADVAAAAAAVASGLADVVLYADRDTLGDPAREVLEAARVCSVMVTGGTAALSDTVAAEAAEAAGVSGVRRFAGTDRAHTAVLVAQAARPGTGGTVVIAVGWDDTAVSVAAVAAASEGSVTCSV